MAKPEKIRLGEVLIEQNLLTEDQLTQALTEQKSSGRKLGRIFIENGFVTEEGIAEAIARQLRIPFINLKLYNVDAELVNRLPETQARRFRALVLEDRGQHCCSAWPTLPTSLPTMNWRVCSSATSTSPQ